MTTTTAHHTTPMSCTCDDWKYSDSYGYRCDHMKNLGKQPALKADVAGAEAFFAEDEAREAAEQAQRAANEQRARQDQAELRAARQVEAKGIVIDIEPAPRGGYCVTAHLPEGDAHDFFTTKGEAERYATEFYGGQVVEQPKKPFKGRKPMTEAPRKTAADCARRAARAHTCTCPDHDNRAGGSYIDERTGENVCAHMAALRLGHVNELHVISLQTGTPIRQLVAQAAAKVKQETGKPSDPRTAVILELKGCAKDSPYYKFKRKELGELNDAAAAMLDMNSPQVRLLVVCARSTDMGVKLAAKIAADDLGTSLGAILRRADALAEAQAA